MKFFVVLSLFATLALVAADHEIRIVNNCGHKVWPGLLNNPGKSLPLNGGFELDAHKTHSFKVPKGWAGRIWGRTGCDAHGACQTGDCGNKIACQHAGGRPPVSLAEFTLDGHGNQDYYDVSLVDGYNLPMQISLIPGTFHKTGNSHYDCNVAGCHADLNAHCPNELALKHDGHTIACKSACEAFNTDEYCCRGAHKTPQTCKAKNWKHNYSEVFKHSCPDAYSYAYDDTSSTFTCHGANTGYIVKFC